MRPFDQDVYERAWWLRQELFAAQRGRPIPSYLSVVPRRRSFWRRTPWWDVAYAAFVVAVLLAGILWTGGRLQVGP